MSQKHSKNGGRSWRSRLTGASTRRFFKLANDLIRKPVPPFRDHALETHHGPMQVVSVGALDLRRDDLAALQRPATRYVSAAIDLRRVAFGAAFGNGRSHLVDDDLLPGADFLLQPPRRDRLLLLHE